MKSSSVVVRREEGLVFATLNRPDKLNALNKEIFDELDALMDRLATDKTARVVIMSGAGEKSFCVGADLKERQGMGEKDILARFNFVRRVYLKMERLGLPIIAAIDGICLGGGLELALACDLRIAGGGSVFGFPEVDLAIIPGNGGTQRLSRIVGMGKALELILMGKRLTSNEAVGMGLIHQAVAMNEAMSEARRWATKLMQAGPLALRQAKYSIRAGLEGTLEEGLALETEAYKVVLRSKDRLEGLKAFHEKRKPVYTGE
jgi:enoyl-CoA hydratase/carnithine racemase